MVEDIKIHLPNKYFWLIATFTWLAALSITTHIQYSALLHTEHSTNWSRTWVLLSPWFLNWIWVSAAIFAITSFIEKKRFSPIEQLIFHALACILLLLSYAVTSTFIRGVLVNRTLDGNMTALVKVLTGSLHMDLFIYCATLSLAFGTRLYMRQIEDRIEVRQLQVQLIQEQLKTLRTQLNPHFLFNALNTIASLVRLKNENEAVVALSSLSVMLRTILENKSNDCVKVKDEIHFIESYLKIQKMRFEDKLAISIDVDEACMSLQIPTMILHPLVENAVHHGAQSASKRNPLQLTVKVIDGMLHVNLRNAFNPVNTHEGHGIGVTNTRERLSRMFNYFHFELRQSDNGIFETHLAIPAGEMDD